MRGGGAEQFAGIVFGSEGLLEAGARGGKRDRFYFPVCALDAREHPVQNEVAIARAARPFRGERIIGQDLNAQPFYLVLADW